MPCTRVNSQLRSNTATRQGRPSPSAYEAFPRVSEKKHVPKSLGKNFPNTFLRKNSPLYPPKFLMTFLKVIDHYFHIFRFPDVNFLLHPPISAFLFNFPPILQVSPIF